MVPSASTGSQSKLGAYLSELLGIISRPSMIMVLFTFILRFLVFFGFLTYVSFFGKQTLGMTTVGVGIMAATKAVISFMSSSQVGRLTGRMHTALVAAMAFGFSGVGMILSGVYPRVVTLVWRSILLGIGDGIVAPVQKSLVTNLSPAELRGGAVSLSSSLSSTGKALAPVTMAWVLAVSDFATIFFVLGCIALLGGSILIGVWRMTRDVSKLQ